MRWAELAQEPCSLARALSVVGDRWTMMVLRDCFLGIRRFEAFEARLGISRATLAGRLDGLVQEGVLARVRYAERPPRFEYRLTEKGLDLHPLILAAVHFGDRHYAGDAGRPVLHRHRACGCDFEPVTTCSACGEPVRPREVETRPGPGAASERARAAGALPFPGEVD